MKNGISGIILHKKHGISGKKLAYINYFLYLCAILRKVEEMKDYQLTSDGLYAYRWPRASVTADAVQVLEIHG